MNKHISYSEWKAFEKCPIFHKLQYVDKIDKFAGNVYTAFGTAIHEASYHILRKNKFGTKVNLDYMDVFNQHFDKEIDKLRENGLCLDDKSKVMIYNFPTKARKLLSNVMPSFRNYFKEFEIFSIEDELYEPIHEYDGEYYFKGFIIVLKDVNNTLWIIDLKTSRNGWRKEIRRQKETVYQLTYYKKFFCQKCNIDLSKRGESALVKTAFAIYKRDLAQNNIEFWNPTNMGTRINNAMKSLVHAINCIENGLIFPSYGNCYDKLWKSTCQYRYSEYCR